LLDNKQIEGIAQLKGLLPHLQEEDAGETCGVWSDWKQGEDGVWSMPYITYKDWVRDITRIAYEGDLVVPDSMDILGAYKIKYSSDIADYASMPEDLALAVLSRIIRGERFCEGAIQSAIKDGSLRKTIERLIAIAGV